jgi:hypothetical protein
MTLLVKGVSKLSQISIDADKDWSGKGISNLKELVLGMVQGDLVVKGAGGVLVAIHPGVASQVLTSNGPGNLPSWQAGGLYFNRYFPATFSVTKALSVAAPNKTITRAAPMTSPYVDTTGDLVGSYLKRLAPAITVPKTAAVIVPDKTVVKTPSLGRHVDIQIVVGGATRAPLGADADETAAAENATANDVSLPPQTPGGTDAYRFGFYLPFDQVILNVGTAGVGVWTVTWKYWNGAWVNLAGVIDGTNGFHNSGTNTITFTRPGDWALKNILGMNLYWVTAEITAYTSRVTQPLGTQAWIYIASIL